MNFTNTLALCAKISMVSSGEIPSAGEILSADEIYAGHGLLPIRFSKGRFKLSKHVHETVSRVEFS